jgi:uncharacterized protein with PIN domain
MNDHPPKIARTTRDTLALRFAGQGEHYYSTLLDRELTRLAIMTDRKITTERVKILRADDTIEHAVRVTVHDEPAKAYVVTHKGRRPKDAPDRPPTIVQRRACPFCNTLMTIHSAWHFCPDHGYQGRAIPAEEEAARDAECDPSFRQQSD